MAGVEQTSDLLDLDKIQGLEDLRPYLRSRAHKWGELETGLLDELSKDREDGAKYERAMRACGRASGYAGLFIMLNSARPYREVMTPRIEAQLATLLMIAHTMMCSAKSMQSETETYWDVMDALDAALVKVQNLG